MLSLMFELSACKSLTCLSQTSSTNCHHVYFEHEPTFDLIVSSCNCEGVMSLGIAVVSFWCIFVGWPAC